MFGCRDKVQRFSSGFRIQGSGLGLLGFWGSFRVGGLGLGVHRDSLSQFAVLSFHSSYYAEAAYTYAGPPGGSDPM